MGTRSYGKGIVQTKFPIGAQGQIQFTTHKFMTAAGIQIHEVGVLPDIVVNGDLAQPMVPPPHPSTDAQPPEKPGIECGLCHLIYEQRPLD